MNDIIKDLDIQKKSLEVELEYSMKTIEKHEEILLDLRVKYFDKINKIEEINQAITKLKAPHN